MDEKSLEMLEFSKVRDILSEFASFAATRELINRLRPSLRYDEVSLWLAQSREARYLLSIDPRFSIGGVRDIRNNVAMAAKRKVLNPSGLLEVQTTLAAVRRLRANIVRLSDDIPCLAALAEVIVPLPHIEQHIESCIDAAAELLDSASIELARIRQQLKATRHQVLNRLERIIKSQWAEKVLQEPLITDRDGRYVIPVKAEQKREIRGIIHDVSNTGATVFLEPWVTVDLGNRLRQLEVEERRETERILSDLSAEVGACEDVLLRNLDLVAEIDLALAKARYASRAGATEPIIIDFDHDRKLTENESGRVFRLTGARHPLIGRKAVPLSIEMGKDFSSLVITGPNTGGKTVALKTIGLLAAMTQAGIPIPADGESCIPLFDGIFSDIGDEQSIEQTLSTFSWHMGNIVRIIRDSTDVSLVLLDELGTSTDPSEGAALARAVLSHFLSKGTLVVATTHFSELKAFAHLTPGFQNASMEFDAETLAPTYHLNLGIPGGSNALEVASQLGLDTQIIASARGLLSEGSLDMDKIIQDLATEHQRIRSLRDELDIHNAQVQRRQSELDAELERVRGEEQDIIRDVRDRVMAEAAELRREIRTVSSDLRKARSQRDVNEVKRSLSEVHERLAGPAWQPETADVVSMVAVEVGDRVRLKSTNFEGTVLSLSEKGRQLEIQAGNTRVRLSLDDVEKVEPSVSDSKFGRVVVRGCSDNMRRSLELDLRGKRADEIEPLLDRFLNDASLARIGQVRIVHGFGTGTVRQIVRDMLPSHPLIHSFRPGEQGEGGDGVTVVEL